ncbi:hypothetical protein [Bradyrhizobium sp. 151]|uniref:hypothetical protein n=1 Tax=Bradyrhizobium sp. 151 TaxID=2782626 RepID=UPI001FFB985D|nr:hypothetical protein [Bradyrhizobium sp. 151]MCK1656670.1 hypothetical protein [Bradyrhizobium sp. 151]
MNIIVCADALLSGIFVKGFASRHFEFDFRATKKRYPGHSLRVFPSARAASRPMSYRFSAVIEIACKTGV